MRRTIKSILLMTLCVGFTLGAYGCFSDKGIQDSGTTDKTVATQDTQVEVSAEPSADVTVEPEVDPASEAELKEEGNEVTDFYKFDDSEADNLAALIYLGYGDEEKEEKLQSLMKEYDLSEDLFEEVVINENCEWYAVFPKYIGSTVKVDSMVMTDEGELTLDKECLETQKPVLLCCNVSDIIPSSQVTVTCGEQKVQWNPFISLEDGSVQKQEQVYTATWQ